MRALKPIVLLLALALAGWILYCQIVNRPILRVQGLIGWSPYNTSPMPAAPTPSSNIMGTGSPLR